MDLTRRQTMMLGLGAAIAATLPATGFASTDLTADAIKAFTGGAEVKEGGVEIGAPEIAENGNTVPVEVSAEGATDILLLAAGNPNPGVATFHFGALGLCERAVRHLCHCHQVLRTVKVTIGGCGG